MHRRRAFITFDDREACTPSVAGVLLLVTSLLMPLASAGELLEAAKAFFARYQRLEQAYDPALAELYSDQARIHLAGPTAEGRMQYFNVPGNIYKGFLRQSMSAARARGDYSEYRGVSFVREDSTVHIEGIRRSMWKGYERPFSMRIRQRDDGRWVIVEEVQNIPAGTGEGASP